MLRGHISSGALVLPLLIKLGKLGIDATIKGRLNPEEFKRVWPKDWGNVDIEDYLD